MMTRAMAYCLLAVALTVDSVVAGDAANMSAWPDTAPLTKRSVVLPLESHGTVRIDVLGERLFRVRYSKTGQWTESALNRYGVLAAAFPEVAMEQSEADGIVTIATKQARLAINRKDGSITMATSDGKTLTQQAAPQYESNGGYDLRFAMAKDERVYGLGDVSRENIMRRGKAYEFWVRNVDSYIPIPVLLSQRGWGLLLNTTWRNTIDVGKSDPDRIVCTAPRSELDYYLFCGEPYRGLLDVYTSLSGRPTLLPIWGYGLTYVCNQNIDAFNMINEAITFRHEQLPCDVIGLEPGWMSKRYDYSTAKEWHPQRFPIPYWAPQGPHTFFGALARKGFRLSLWLCCDYDLSLFEEQQIAGEKSKAASGDSGASQGAVNVEQGFEDKRLAKPKDVKPNDAGKNDAVMTAAPEPWFDHLKKFVDQGVSAFKLDGANQVMEHADRKWGNGMTDEEMHNLYPVIYAKQMANGFERHAKRRAMIYSAGGYTGLQRYVATWAGDTGGGADPLVSMLNLGFSGHSNHSCDMSVTDSAGLHFGFLQTWAQQCNWDYWYQPWLLNDTETAAYRQYDQLRYRLLPYLYSSAAEATMTGYPVMRAMSLVYPDDPAWDACTRQYMLGDFLLVSAFSKEVRVPEGDWYDYWSGLRVQGPATLPVEITPTRGGALLVKGGAILPTWPPCSHVAKGWSPEIGLLVYPAGRSEWSLYEDDGTSLAYREGKYARTRLICEATGKTVKLTIAPRDGSFDAMPAARDFVATLRLPARPKSITLDGKAVADGVWNDAQSTITVTIPGCGNSPRVLMCK